MKRMRTIAAVFMAILQEIFDDFWTAGNWLDLVRHTQLFGGSTRF